MDLNAYRQHPIHSSVLRLLAIQESKKLTQESVSSTPPYALARDKCFAIAHVLNEFIQQTPPELVVISAIDTMQPHLDAVVSALTSFLGDENPEHIVNASNIMERNVVPFFWAFIQGPRGVSEGSNYLAESQSEFAAKSIQQIAEQRDSLRNMLNVVEDHTKALAAKIDDLSESVARERGESAAAVAKLDQSFSLNESQRQATFDTSIQAQHNFAKNELDIQAIAASKTLEDLNVFKEQAAKIVQVVGNIGVTGNYQRIATSEGESANFWRWITVAIFGTGIALAMATFYKFWHEPFSQDTAVSVLIRLFYAIVITSPAIYTARESARHRTNADRARQTELELASIGPFIELLPEESKVAIRTGLTSSYFGRATEAHTVSSPLDPEHFKNLVEMLKAVKPS
ncbi:hypothetical protein [Pseudomonas sp. PD9R]|uniref:hypothetical protein n=1 Tax=Pseudomonas sp. PD9R TaxID=2853534 RepID=UPI001C45174E|nr:hypothetical protein [Pseudomonas sp. PD9R]MBV6823865.1 hypothetical protein [Pseudomonas sp. PD9R]